MDATGELAQLGESRAQLGLRAVEHRGRLGVVLDHEPEPAEQQIHADDPPLRAVVQVALDAPAFGVARVDEPGTRRAQLVQPRHELGVEACDVALQQPAEERERQERGHAEGQPPEQRRVGGGPGGHDEERGEPARVHGPEGDAVERVGTPPVLPEPCDHDDEEHDIERRLYAGQGIGQIRVALDQPQVPRAVVARQLLRTGEEQRRDGAQGEQPVARERDPAVGSRWEAARREAHEKVQEHAAPQAAGHEPEREGECRVRQGDRRDAPREAEGDHEHADAAAGPPVRGVEAGSDEAQHHGRPEDRPGEVRVLPVAREQEHDHARAAEDGADHDDALPRSVHGATLPQREAARKRNARRSRFTARAARARPRRARRPLPRTRPPRAARRARSRPSRRRPAV